MKPQRWFALAALLPMSLVAQSPATNGTQRDVVFAFENMADIFGSRLVAAFDSIPPARYSYRPTPAQQTVGYIAQHVEAANYDLCSQFSNVKHAETHKDSLSDSVKARWPKDTLVARLDASLRFCDTVLDQMRRMDTPELANLLLRFETDLAEHYSQISIYMRLLGLVPPSALPPKKHATIELTTAELAPLVGVYQTTVGPRLDVTMREGKLFIASSGGGATVRLWPETPNKFFVKEVEVEITFTRSASGAVTGLVFHQWDRDRVATRRP